MNLHEYQAKNILEDYGVAVQRGKVLFDRNDTKKVADKLVSETNTKWFVVKAQIHAGGRGKGGGVKIAKNRADLDKVELWVQTATVDGDNVTVSSSEADPANVDKLSVHIANDNAVTGTGGVSSTIDSPEDYELIACTTDVTGLKTLIITILPAIIVAIVS